jgi:uncharacterized protein (TIGR03437 family)
MCAIPLVCGTVQQLPALPHGATAQALQVDAAGTIYVAGSLTPESPKSTGDTSDAFVAKLSPDGSQVLYFTVLGGSGADAAMVLAVGSDDSVYVTGTTSSSDFPVTNGALQTAYGGKMGQAFAAKLNPGGTTVYATYIGGTADTSGAGAAVDGAGDAFVLGVGQPTGVAAIVGGDTSTLGGFVVKLDPAGSKILMGFAGVGGEYMAIDGEGNVYLVGGSLQVFTPPFTPGAFQNRQDFAACGGDSFFGLPCFAEYVAKVDATGTQLIYLTGLNGTYGATPAGIAADEQGNAIVAGSTNSPDFPVTPDTFESVYAPAIPSFFSSFGPSVPNVVPPTTGFIAKLNATGSALVWSTFFGGSTSDAIGAMALDSAGGVVIAGEAGSTDFPGTEDAPAGCRPSAIEEVGFAARLSADGTSILPSQLLYGAVVYAYGAVEQAGPIAVASAATGSVVELEKSGAIRSGNLFTPSRLACVTDPADNVQLASVSPGQDISVFGTELATPSVTSGGTPIAPSNAVAATFDGNSATILYTSTGQVNVQVPAAIAAETSTVMEMTDPATTPPLDGTLALGVTAQQPSVFLTADGLAGAYASCLPAVAAPAAVALNADGSLNSPINPAAAGSKVTILLNGVDLSRWASLTVTGMANQNPISFTAGAPNAAVLPVSFLVPATDLNGITLSQLKVGGVAVREQFVGVCVTPSTN